MPRLLLAAVFAVALVPVAAAASPPNKEQVRLNPADQAAARASVLRRADLGSGWAGGATKPDLSSTMNCPGYTPKQSDLVLTGAAEADFRRTGLEVRSVAQVLKTPSMVTRDWQRTVLDSRAFACLRRMLSTGLTSQERLVSFRRLAFPHLARYANAFRALVEVRAQGQRVRVVSDLVVVGRSRTELTLSVTAPAVAKANLVVAEAKLARAMLGRARA